MKEIIDSWFGLKKWFGPYDGPHPEKAAEASVLPKRNLYK